jgi:hypothetical protein
VDLCRVSATILLSIICLLLVLKLLSRTSYRDPGTHADCPETFLVRLISFTITLGGMLIFALMIGIISEYIAEKGELLNYSFVSNLVSYLSISLIHICHIINNS